jgi:diguanylate cyclase (GGDEF)-like protein
VSEPGGSKQQVLASLRSAVATVTRRARRRGWAAVAALVLVCGIVGSAVAAVTMARSDASDSRVRFRSESAQITSTLRLAIQHEQDLIVNASGFVTGDPAASQAQFVSWARSVHALARYPELRGIGHSVIVPAPQLPAFAARATRDAARSPLGGKGAFRVVPSSRRAFYCLSVWSLSRTTADAFPPGYDFCARGPVGTASRSSRDSGLGAYLPIQAPKLTLLSILTPVYRNGVFPTTVAARRRAFLGWVGMSVVPRTVLARALEGHPDTAVTFRYHSSSSNAVFRAGQAPSGAQSLLTVLHNGWTVQTFAAPASSAVSANSNALTVLIGGIAVSVLVAALMLVLATGRFRAMRLVALRTRELRYQALHDPLTGLPNRALTIDRVDQLLARNHRAGTDCAALYVDLDHFKNINDTLGHEAGDRLLTAVASRLTSTLPDANTIGRIGGDEFVVLIDGGEPSVAPSLLAERVLAVMRQPFELSETATTLNLSTSIGIAVGDRATPDELLRDADVALYQAKASGKNRYKTFQPALAPEISRRVGLVFDLRSALADGQFRLEYQPIYNLDDLTVAGVETLLRWEHPISGLIGPDEFIPLLEQSGQIAEVGRWVLNQACEQMAAWHARGDTLDISINVSAGQLDSDAIIGHISDALASSGLDPTCLIIEVTETALMDNPDATARRLHAIKQLGVRIAVDDFGTGYSSLAYLQQFPADSLKIDRMFIASPASDALIRTFVQLGQDLGLTTLAEGVETPRELDRLRAGHVDQIQGFLLCKPLDAHTLENQILAPTRPAAPPSRQP